MQDTRPMYTTTGKRLILPPNGQIGTTHFGDNVYPKQQAFYRVVREYNACDLGNSVAGADLYWLLMAYATLARHFGIIKGYPLNYRTVEDLTEDERERIDILFWHLSKAKEKLDTLEWVCARKDKDPEVLEMIKGGNFVHAIKDATLVTLFKTYICLMAEDQNLRDFYDPEDSDEAEQVQSQFETERERRMEAIKRRCLFYQAQLNIAKDEDLFLEIIEKDYKDLMHASRGCGKKDRK